MKPDRNVRAFLALVVVAMITAHLLDAWMFAHFRIDDVYGEDWGRMLRVLGFLPLWLIAALALALEDREQFGYIRAVLLAAAPALAGGVGELLKLVFRRERPNAHDGEYVFRAFSERTWSTGGLALPSSHAIVAFGGAAILSRLFPRAKLVWWALAWGCALTRVAAGAHFFSDVMLSAIGAWCVVWLLWKRFGHKVPAV